MSGDIRKEYASILGEEVFEQSIEELLERQGLEEHRLSYSFMKKADL